VPILRIKEIRGMSTEDRDKKISELKAELARLKTMIRAGGAVENPARVRELRKTIAKVLTIEIIIAKRRRNPNESNSRHYTQ
jgi:large subunit ribosomal protein L29